MKKKCEDFEVIITRLIEEKEVPTKKRAEEDKLSDSEEMRDLGVFKGKNGSSGIGKMPDDAENVAVLSTSNSGGLSKKGNRKSFHPKIEENDDDDDAHHTVKTPRISQSDRNLPRPESNKHKEPMVSGNIIERVRRSSPPGDDHTAARPSRVDGRTVLQSDKRRWGEPCHVKEELGVEAAAVDEVKATGLADDEEPGQDHDTTIPYDQEMADEDEGEATAQEAAQEAERNRKGKGKKKKKAKEQWRLTGPMRDGGPMIPDLIPSFGGHVAVDVWKNKERGPLKIYTRAADLKEWTGFDPVGEMTEYTLLKDTGLAHLHEMTYRVADSALISAFVERWQPDRNTFHMPFGEMTITLHDVFYMMGLPVDGAVCVPTSKGNTRAKLAKLLELLPDELSFKESLPHVKEWLKIYSERRSLLPPSSRVQMYLMYMLSCTLFVDRSTNKVHTDFLHLLQPLPQVSSYAWGAGALTFLFRSLGETSRADIKGFCGAHTLLECWIYEYFPCLRPVPNPDYRSDQPAAFKWINHDRATNSKIEMLQYYRRVLDNLTAEHVCWTPHGLNVLDEVPRSFFAGSIRFLGDTEGYFPHTVTRQYGFVQHIPEGRGKMEPNSCLSRNPREYKVQWPNSDAQWDIPGAGELDRDVYDEEAIPSWTTSHDYLGWYTDRTHPRVSPLPPPPQILPRPPVADISMDVSRLASRVAPGHTPSDEEWRAVLGLCEQFTTYYGLGPNQTP
ncbi:hypothetical protein CASFOL_036779 [Castilleja foliolosa]|uniref:Aminotransferase-like plant mobile domain-containing protein n=1 Tax=Castilleja foliolosa TaxID=1961234 RepID=A0ABD3BQ01_9LAMI